MFRLIGFGVQHFQTGYRDFIGHRGVFKLERCDAAVEDDAAALILKVIDQRQHDAFKLIVTGAVDADQMLDLGELVNHHMHVTPQLLR